jgi:hypothetical protein
VGLAVPETEYIIGRQNGTFAAPIYGPSVAKPPSQPKKELSFMERLWEEQTLEFWREAARITARSVFRPATTFAGGSYQQPTSPFAPDKELFGMTAYICTNCYAMKPRIIYYNEGDKGGSVETFLACLSGAPDYIDQMKQSRDEYIASASKGYPNFLKTCVEAWTNRKTIIIAVEVVDPGRTNNIITFVRSRSTGQKISITLRYSEEKCAELDPASTGDWALRAISDRRTVVKEKELTEFLEKTKDSTFGFFKMKKDGIEHIYLLAVARSEDNSTLSMPKDEIDVTIPAEQEKAQKSPDEGAFSSILNSPAH